MKSTIKDKLTAIGFMALLVAVLAANIILPDKDVSAAERRRLDQFPELTAQTVFEGDFFEELEDYGLDQFVLRDTLRTVKSAVRLNVLMQLESNDLFLENGGIFKLPSQLNATPLQTNCEKLMRTAESIWPEANLYYSIIPEKNSFLESTVYPAIDAEKYSAAVAQYLNGAQNIAIDDLLDISDYYLTDPHWKQECIKDVADRLLTSMGGTAEAEEYTLAQITDFYGTYHGQLPLASEKDTLCSLHSEKTDAAEVYNYETGKTGGVYNPAKLEAMDPYDYYLDGACALLRIENPEGTPGKELVIFRDSFGSSIAPLLLGDYSSVTLVDLRYVSSQILGQYVSPGESTDVLFLFSQTILNNNGVFR